MDLVDSVHDAHASSVDPMLNTPMEPTDSCHASKNPTLSTHANSEDTMYSSRTNRENYEGSEYPMCNSPKNGDNVS